MKVIFNIRRFSRFLAVLLSASLLNGAVSAQEETVAATEAVTEPASEKAKAKPVKNTFEGMWLIDNQSVMVPIKGTFEMDIMHRFGVVKNGYNDFWGLFAPSNIRLGFSYVPIKDLNVGLGITKSNMTWDGSLKYAIMRQTKGSGGFPVSVTYYGNASYETRDKENYIYASERLRYFNQLIIARKFTDRFSFQVAPSVSHQNSVPGFYKQYNDSLRGIEKEMKHDHIAVAFSGRFKIKEGMSLIANYDQPVTKHTTNNPNPNLSFGLEMSTSNHTFQIFGGNFSLLSPQRDNLFNKNSFKEGEFVIGFNITRTWNY